MIGQSGLILALLALVAFVVFKPQSDRFCEHHKVGCSLTTGFLSTGVVVLAGYFVLFVWTIRKAQSYYMNLARETPDRLMATPPLVRTEHVLDLRARYEGRSPVGAVLSRALSEYGAAELLAVRPLP